jgi:hypothetical protein
VFTEHIEPTPKYQLEWSVIHFFIVQYCSYKYTIPYTVDFGQSRCSFPTVPIHFLARRRNAAKRSHVVAAIPC